MNDVWTTEDETVYVHLGNTQTEVGDEVTAEDVQRVARNEGVKKFQVEDENGDSLSQDDFPVQSDVHIQEYNENA